MTTSGRTTRQLLWNHNTTDPENFVAREYLPENLLRAIKNHGANVMVLIKTFLEENKENTKTMRCKDGYNLLHRLILHDNVEGVKYLLHLLPEYDRMALIHSTKQLTGSGETNKSSMALAIGNCNPEMVELLLETGYRLKDQKCNYIFVAARRLYKIKRTEDKELGFQVLCKISAKLQAMGTDMTEALASVEPDFSGWTVGKYCGEEGMTRLLQYLDDVRNIPVALGDSDSRRSSTGSTDSEQSEDPVVGRKRAALRQPLSAPAHCRQRLLAANRPGGDEPFPGFAQPWIPVREGSDYQAILPPLAKPPSSEDCESLSAAVPSLPHALATAEVAPLPQAGTVLVVDRSFEQAFMDGTNLRTFCCVLSAGKDEDNEDAVDAFDGEFAERVAWVEPAYADFIAHRGNDGHVWSLAEVEVFRECILKMPKDCEDLRRVWLTLTDAHQGASSSSASSNNVSSSSNASSSHSSRSSARSSSRGEVGLSSKSLHQVVDFFYREWQHVALIGWERFRGIYKSAEEIRTRPVEVVEEVHCAENHEGVAVVKVDETKRALSATARMAEEEPLSRHSPTCCCQSPLTHLPRTSDDEVTVESVDERVNSVLRDERVVERDAIRAALASAKRQHAKECETVLAAATAAEHRQTILLDERQAELDKCRTQLHAESAVHAAELRKCQEQLAAAKAELNECQTQVRLERLLKNIFAEQHKKCGEQLAAAHADLDKCQVQLHAKSKVHAAELKKCQEPLAAAHAQIALQAGKLAAIQSLAAL